MLFYCPTPGAEGMWWDQTLKVDGVGSWVPDMDLIL